MNGKNVFINDTSEAREKFLILSGTTPYCIKNMFNSGPRKISYRKNETFNTMIPIVTYGNVPDGFLSLMGIISFCQCYDMVSVSMFST